MPKNDPVNHPKHYLQGAVEVIEITNDCAYRWLEARKDSWREAWRLR